MPVCEKCGVDHDVEAREQWPEMMFLLNSLNEAKEVSEEDIGTVILKFSHYASDLHAEPTLHWGHSNHKPLMEAVQMLGALMFQYGFMVGNKTHHHWPNLFSETQMPTEEESRKSYEEQEKINQAASDSQLMKATDEQVKFLKSLGIDIPEDSDVHLMIGGDVPVVDNSDDTPPPGMYL